MGFKINLDGMAAQKTLVPEDAYEAVITSIGELMEFKTNFPGKDGKLEEKTQEKFPVEWTLKTKGYEEKKVTMFLSPRVSKGSGTYSNSKLYDVLEKANLLEKFRKANRLLDDEIMTWLKTELKDRLARISVKNTISKKTGDKYSTVDKVIRFLDVAEEVKI